MDDLWTFDGCWWRLHRRTYSIQVRAEEVLEDTVTDAEVHIAGHRYSASFATPECLREILDRWAHTGEHHGGCQLWMGDLVVLPRMGLPEILRAVEDLLLEGELWTALTLLQEDPDPEQ